MQNFAPFESVARTVTGPNLFPKGLTRGDTVKITAGVEITRRKFASPAPCYIKQNPRELSGKSGRICVLRGARFKLSEITIELLRRNQWAHLTCGDGFVYICPLKFCEKTP